jgi:hypothetical protein
MAQRQMANLIHQQIVNLLLQYPELEEDDQLRADMIERETDTLEFLAMLERKRQEAEAMFYHRCLKHARGLQRWVHRTHWHAQH